jgi:hypothetical protein
MTRADRRPVNRPVNRPVSRPVEEYLVRLAASLPTSRTARELLDEIRDHLDEAVAAGEAAGASREAAELQAVRELGSVTELAPDFRTVAIVCEARRQANRQLVGVLVLAAWILSVFHLVPTTHTVIFESGHPWPVAMTAVATLLGPSLLLLGFSRTSWPWRGARWLAWLSRARTVASCLFQLGLPASSAMVAHQVALLLGGPHLWLAAGAVGGHVVASVLVPTTGLRQLAGGIARRR